MAWLAAVYLKHLCGFYLTRGYLSANSIVNRPCPNRRFILCHRAADQSNRIKNNEIARISLTKYTYTYIYIYISNPPYNLVSKNEKLRERLKSNKINSERMKQSQGIKSVYRNNRREEFYHLLSRIMIVV